MTWSWSISGKFETFSFRKRLWLAVSGIKSNTVFSNAPFEGRTACWIPYAETGYTKGKKTGEEKDGKIEVERLVDGKVKMFKAEDVEPQNPPKYELLEDMANMTYLSEVS